MKLVVGLGNPGPRYETTRHNVGWLAFDRLVEAWKASGPKTDKMAELFRTKIGSEDILMIKPQTFMNLLGRAVQPVMNFYKLEVSDLIVLHDELDIPPCTMKLKSGGGNGGHNGLKSIDELLGSNQYTRIRLGIGHPRNFGLRIDTADYVLGQIPDEDLPKWDSLFTEVTRACEMIIQGNLLKAMTQFNRKVEE